MGFRTTIIDKPTYHRIETCDVCKKDIDDLKEYNDYVVTERPQRWYRLNIKSSLYEEFEQRWAFCSIDCFEKWIAELKRIYPGLR